jgi:hypothetical protein
VLLLLFLFLVLFVSIVILFLQAVEFIEEAFEDNNLEDHVSLNTISVPFIILLLRFFLII